VELETLVNKLKVVMSAAGRYHSVHLARALLAQGALQKFFYAGLPGDQQYFPQDKLSFHNLVSLADRIFVKLSLDRFCLLSRWYTWRDKYFDEQVANQIDNVGPFNVFVGWANGCLATLKKIKKQQDAITIVEAGSMHIFAREKILEQEFARHGIATPKMLEENKNRMLEEYQLADYIAVPSEHVKQSFLAANISEHKILKIPYGCNVERFFSERPKPSHGPMIFLFVGQVCLGKGIYYLLSAWRRLGLRPEVAQLHIVGNVSSDCDNLVGAAQDTPGIIFHGSKAQDSLRGFYRNAHVLVFPSLSEGLAMVIGEAMAAGLAVICTQNSGGPELLADTQAGLLVPPADAKVLADKIAWCLANRDAVLEMGQQARSLARQYTWQDYGERIIKKYTDLLEK